MIFRTFLTARISPDPKVKTDSGDVLAQGTGLAGSDYSKGSGIHPCRSEPNLHN